MALWMSGAHYNMCITITNFNSQHTDTSANTTDDGIAYMDIFSYFLKKFYRHPYQDCPIYRWTNALSRINSLGVDNEV